MIGYLNFQSLGMRKCKRNPLWCVGRLSLKGIPGVVANWSFQTYNCIWSKRIFEQYICTSAQFHIMNFNQLKSSLVSSLLDMTIFVSLQKYCDTPLFSNSPWSLAVIVMLTEFRMFATDPRFPRFDPWTFPSSGKWPKVGGSQFKGNKVVLKDVFEVTWGSTKLQVLSARVSLQQIKMAIWSLPNWPLWHVCS